MPDLITPANTRAILKKHDISAKKRFGQNFLVNRHILEKILAAAEIKESDTILEIGPGIGTLTQYLAERAKKVIAIEIDHRMTNVLNETLSAYRNVIIINDDILKTDLAQIIQEHNHGKPLKVVANLPYYITTPLIMSLLEGKHLIDSMTVMVQKEVAARMQASPNSKDYGALSLAVQYHAQVEYIATVSPSCFFPQPNVESAILRLLRYATPPVEVDDEAFLFAIIRAAFNQRRKTLANALNSEDLNLTRDKVVSILKEINLDERIRGEALSLDLYAKLSTKLIDSNIF
jgi:16S rRNA (adenine1518-N6/adenine1519-N6)-dimethyltransferase